jgi:hypothetical protein
MLSFSQNWPEDFPISPIASRSGIFPPSADYGQLMSQSMIARPVLTNRLRWLAHLQSHVRIDPAGAAATSVNYVAFLLEG